MRLLKLKNHYKDKSTVNIIKHVFIAVFLSVIFLYSIGCLFLSITAILKKGEETAAIATAFPGNGLINCIVSEMQEKYINQDIEEKSEEEKYAMSHNCEMTPMSEESVKLKDIYSVYDVGETAVFKCYKKDATQYTWDTYDASLSDWVAVPQEEITVMLDELNREISTYKVAAVQDNDGLIVRCRTDLQSGETVTEIGILYILDGITNISASDYTADSGKYISIKDIPISITFSDGSERVVNGLNGLYFLETIEGDSSVTNDVYGNPIEQLTVVKKYREYAWLKPEERETTIRYHNGDTKIDIPIVLKGEDNDQPDILQVDINEGTGNAGESELAAVTITATDNSTSYSELEYAFLPESDEPEDTDWINGSRINVDIDASEKWKAYCRDKSGNIASLSVDIFGEVINGGEVEPETSELSISLSLEIKDIWSTYNKIIVANTDASEYRYVMVDNNDEDSGWITRPEYVVNANGTYKVYARDAAGNVAEGEIIVSNIDNNPPVIQSIKEKEI